MLTDHRGSTWAVVIALTWATAAGVKAETPQTGVADNEVRIVAEKMCCKGCAQKASAKLYALKGVRAVAANLTDRTLTVDLPRADPAVLETLWRAVEEGGGGPTSLTTAEATYRANAVAKSADDRPASPPRLQVVIDNLHCKGCAQKIAAQLYAVKGVKQVNVDMKAETLFVVLQPAAQVSSWDIAAAVARAKERALEVAGPTETLEIAWTTESQPKSHQAQSQQAGVLR